ncbi:MAG: diguanylate cyclase [Lachnospiraceae bacterium]|nr:diguanylate cyclase [Lachnospiraceae bacterium]
MIVFSVSVMIACRLFLPDNEDEILDFSEGWTDEDGRPWKIDDAREKDFEGDVSLTKQLPADLSDSDSLCFESLNTYFMVYVDGKAVYAFAPEKNLTGMGYGINFHTVPLEQGYAGAELKIVFCGVDDKTPSCSIMNVKICTAWDYIRTYVRGSIFPAIVSFVVMIIGFIMAVLYFRIPDKENMPFNILALGVTAIIVGNWLLVDSNVPILLTGHMSFWRVINRTVVLTIPYPAVRFFNSITRTKRPGYEYMAFFISLISIPAAICIRIFAGVDMMVSFFPILTVIIIAMAVIMALIYLDDQRYCRKNGTATAFREYYPGMICLLVCIFIDIVIFFLQLRVRVSYGNFSRIGAALFVLLTLLSFLSWWTRDRASIEKDRFINRSMQYAMSSDNPEDCIRYMLDYMGKELETESVSIFEDQGNGRFRVTYDWHRDEHKSKGSDLLYLPFRGFVDEFYRSISPEQRSLVIKDPEEYRTSSPGLYELLKKYKVKTLVAGPLEYNGKLRAVIIFQDAPVELLDTIAEIPGLSSYFLISMLSQKEEQKRLQYYSYTDSLSGAQNRRAFTEYLEDGLDMASPFGYLVCSIRGLDLINAEKGYEAGDKQVVELADCLKFIFGEKHVYRMGGAEFAAFGFELDETFFDNDVARMRKLAKEKEINLAMGSAYCTNGTMNISAVIDHAYERMKREKDRERR